MSEQKQLTMKRCPACGEYLEVGKITKTFHNSACRSRYWHARKLIGQHAEMCQRYIADMMRFESDPLVGENVHHALYEIIATLRMSASASDMMSNYGGREE